MVYVASATWQALSHNICRFNISSINFGAFSITNGASHAAYAQYYFQPISLALASGLCVCVCGGLKSFVNNASELVMCGICWN